MHKRIIVTLFTLVIFFGSSVCAQTIQGDINSDGQIDITDLGIILSAWNSTLKPPSDINRDGMVDVLDLGILLGNWGKIIKSDNSGNGTTYYIKNGGDDSASGISDETAWATIAKVNAQNFTGGDIVQFKRGSVFTDKTLTLAGTNNSIKTVDGGLTIRDYGLGQKPLINGDKVKPISIERPNIELLIIKNLDLSGQNYWKEWKITSVGIKKGVDLVLDGLEANGHGGEINTALGWSFLYIGGFTGDVEVKNCKIFNYGPTGVPTGDNECMGLTIAYQEMGNYSIHDNKIYNINADCIQLYGSTAEGRVYNNTLYNGGENSIDVKGSSNVEIYGNDFFREPGVGLAGSGSNGSLVVIHATGGDLFNVFVHHNNFHDHPYFGIGLSPGVSGNEFLGATIMYNNFTDVSLPIYAVGQTSNLTITNNTIIGYSDSPIYINSSASGIVVKDNEIIEK